MRLGYKNNSVPAVQTIFSWAYFDNYTKYMCTLNGESMESSFAKADSMSFCFNGFRFLHTSFLTPFCFNVPCKFTPNLNLRSLIFGVTPFMWFFLMHLFDHLFLFCLETTR